MALKYLKEFFLITFSMTVFMLFIILCIGLFFAPWLLGIYLETKGASSLSCFSTVILAYAVYYVFARSFGFIEDF